MTFITQISDRLYEVRCIAWRFNVDRGWVVDNWIVGTRKAKHFAHQLARSIAEPIFIDPCNA